MDSQQELKRYICRRLEELGTPYLHISLSEDAAMENAEEIIASLKSIYEQYGSSHKKS